MKYKGLLEECVDTVFQGYFGQMSGLIGSGAQLDQALSPTSVGSLEDHKWYPFIQYVNNPTIAQSSFIACRGSSAASLITGIAAPTRQTPTPISMASRL